MIICDGLGLENGIYTGEVVMENYNLTTISKLLMHFSRNIYRGSFRLLP
jgi:hypothetical protein